LVALLVSGCEDHRQSPTAGQVSSLLLSLHQPSDLGTPMAPIATPTAVFDVQAVDDQGAPVHFDVDADLYLSFGGVKTGAQSSCGGDGDGFPIETLHLPGGQLLGHTLMLPQAFGAATLWLEDPVSHATGASPTIYFRNPFIADVQTPPDVNAPNASFCSPFNNKFIIVDHPAMPGGQLVVSSVFGNAIAVTDTSYGDYAHFNSMYLYLFGKPPLYLVPGKVLNSFSGNVSKFLGFTELNFPLYDASPAGTALATLPPPSVVTEADIANLPKLIALDAGVVTFTGKECDPLPANPNNDPNIQKTIDSWNKFNQFVIDGDTTCGSFTNFAVALPAKMLGSFDPLQSRGKTLTVTGMLRNNSGQNSYTDASGNPIACDANTPCANGTCVGGICKKGAFNFWTINPRTPDDVVVQ
jgi:hypothetical protein